VRLAVLRDRILKLRVVNKYLKLGENNVSTGMFGKVIYVPTLFLRVTQLFPSDREEKNVRRYIIMILCTEKRVSFVFFSWCYSSPFKTQCIISAAVAVYVILFYGRIQHCHRIGVV